MGAGRQEEVGGIMIKYKTNLLGNDIQAVEVQRETKNSVWREYDGMSKKHLRQERKVTEHERYFDTWQEAKQSLLNYLDEKIQRAHGDLEKYKSQHGNISGMEEPVNQ